VVAEEAAEVRGIVRPRWTAEADPGEALALRKQNSHITAGNHMNKKHWITLDSGEGVDKDVAFA
jgi:predicted DNA-binding protein (MmcQ/YjbR family)